MGSKGPTIILHPDHGDGDRRLAEAIADFAGADSLEALWPRLQEHMGSLGFESLMYGTAVVRTVSQPPVMQFSFPQAYLADKHSDGLDMSTDVFCKTVLRETAPLLWSKTDLVEELSPEEKRSLDVDWDHGIITGVSIPLVFRGGLSVSGFGCHVPGMSWAEFDRLWQNHGAIVMAITGAFDERMRMGLVKDHYALRDPERDCLSWLARGLMPKQISHRLGLTDKAVQRHIAAARRKLNAATVPQALATALVYGLIDP